ncbi:hypothetical protein T03_4232 [Trichinella britovi]|uniref:Uncharacterized protein n=1 Tax=Trichinella britovi TaxID=45882 RepID=A0A0V1C761_TRIBR|nr:hypothetical protein T03_4232 [Trichinella britovi]
MIFSEVGLIRAYQQISEAEEVLKAAITTSFSLYEYVRIAITHKHSNVLCINTLLMVANVSFPQRNEHFSPEIACKFLFECDAFVFVALVSMVVGVRVGSSENCPSNGQMLHLSRFLPIEDEDCSSSLSCSQVIPSVRAALRTLHARFVIVLILR